MGRKKVDTPLNYEDHIFYNEFVVKYDKFILSRARIYAYPGLSAEDIKQEVEMKLMGYVPRLRTLTHNKTCSYISETVWTTFCDMDRKEKRHSYVPLDSEIEETVGMEFDFVSDLFQRQQLQKLQQNVTTREWRVLKKKYSYGYSQEELSTELGMKPDSVRMFLSRLCKRCVKILEPEKVTGGGGDEE